MRKRERSSEVLGRVCICISMCRAETAKTRRTTNDILRRRWSETVSVTVVRIVTVESVMSVTAFLGVNQC